MKQSPNWDCKHSLERLVKENPECVYNPDYKPHSDSDCTLPLGCILLKHDYDDDGYTEIALSKEGWEYTCDLYNPGGKNLTKMNTAEAIRVIEGRLENHQKRYKMTTKIKTDRQAANLSQREAAELVGVNLRTWQRWESGESRVPNSARLLFDRMIKEMKK